MARGIETVLREPLLHFLILGILVFGLYGALADGPRTVPANVLEVSEADARRLAQQYEATWGRPPRPAELEGLIDTYIREEVYVREALALGLDRDDTVVRRRLQQKMEFLTESGAEAVEPTRAELAAHLEANAGKFARQSLVAFEQVPMAVDATADEIDAALARLRGGRDPAEVGERSLLPRDVAASPRVVVDGTFGDGFFETVSSLEPGTWAGPVRSSYGPHLVRVREVVPGRLPPLDEIEAEVERDWRVKVAERLKAERYQALLSLYEVRRPDAAAVLSH